MQVLSLALARSLLALAPSSPFSLLASLSLSIDLLSPLLLSLLPSLPFSLSPAPSLPSLPFSPLPPHPLPLRMHPSPPDSLRPMRQRMESDSMHRRAASVTRRVDQETARGRCEEDQGDG
eukprot:2611687-Rhodomonas_salina.3